MEEKFFFYMFDKSHGLFPFYGKYGIKNASIWLLLPYRDEEITPRFHSI